MKMDLDIPSKESYMVEGSGLTSNDAVSELSDTASSLTLLLLSMARVAVKTLSPSPA